VTSNPDFKVTILIDVKQQTVNDGVAHSHFTISCYHISDDPSIRLRPAGAILMLQQICPYLVTFDLEHIVDADRPGEFGEDPTIWLGEAILTDQRHRRTEGQMDAGRWYKKC